MDTLQKALEEALRDARKEQSQILTHFIAHPFAVFRHPDKMVLGVVDGMTGPFESHASSITDFIGLWPIGLFLPAQRAGHPSPHSREKVMPLRLTSYIAHRIMLQG